MLVNTMKGLHFNHQTHKITICRLRGAFMNKGLGVVFLAAFVFFIYTCLCGFSSCTNTSSQPKGEPGNMVMTACTACHDTQRICDALGKKDKDAWAQTVDRMVGKGAALDKDSIPQVVDFLASLKAGSQPICK